MRNRIYTIARLSLKLWLFAGLVACLSLVSNDRLQAVLSQQSDRPRQSRAERVERKFDELLAKARLEGAVRVIVGLDVGFQPEGELTSSQAVQEQRASFAQAQQSFLDRLVAYNPDLVKRFETIPFIALEVDAAALERMRTFADVVSIEEDVVMKPSLAESTQIVGATAAWARGFSGAGQTIAILDTGVDKNHPFLAGKVVSEACYSTNNSVATSLCPNGVTVSETPGSGLNCPASVAGCDHGTHVAGIAAGRGSSFSGVARDANVIAIQVFSRFNSSADCGGMAPCAGSYTSDQMKGLERVRNLSNSFNIAAVNLSVGGRSFTSNCDANNPGMTAAINSLRSVGIATIIASGNDGHTNALGSPACISSAISVGSTDDGCPGTTLDAVSHFSNSASFLNLLAPGQCINSSLPGGRFANSAGTSMAAPHVAGAFAVLRSSAPNADVTQILSALTSTGANITDSRNGITKPRIRIDAALDALNNSACSYTISPLNQSFTASGGQGSVSVTTASNCTWQASSNANWITINSGASGNGNGTVRYSVQSNPGANSRTGSLRIAGRSFTVTQSGSGNDPCVARTPISIGQSLTGTLASGDCRDEYGYLDYYSFSAVSGQQIAINLDSTTFNAYLMLFGPNGNHIISDNDGGGGTNARIPANNGFFTLPSTGTYVIAAASLYDNETGSYTLRLSAGSNCTYSINPITGSIIANGGGGSVAVTTASGCAWTATSNASWITISSGASGSGSGTVNYSVAANTGANQRIGTMTIAGQTFTVTQSGAVNPTPSFVSAASFLGQTLASESIVAAFGANLATGVGSASSLPLPTVLLGTTVRVRDSFGVERFAPLFFVAPSQVNFLIPADTANGASTITIISGNNSISVGTIQIASVAPALFSANANGRGVAAGVVSRVRANSSQSYEPISQFDQALNQFVAIPIALGPPTDQVFLILYGTGIRFHSGPPAVTASIGRVNVEVLYAGHVIGLAGLDQVNLSLPRSLIGRGEVDVVITVDGKVANTVRVSIGSGAVQSTVSGQR